MSQVQQNFLRTDTHRVLRIERFPRTMAEAFKGPDYACAIEGYRVPMLQRFFRWIRRLA